MTAMREPLQNILGQNAAAGEFRALAHQLEDGFFSLAADDRRVAEVDDQLAFLEVSGRFLPRALQFRNPGLDELALNNQATFGLRVDDGNLQHSLLYDTTAGATEWPKRCEEHVS